jgi:hypothetical protein
VVTDDIVTRLRNGDGFCAGDHEEQCPVPDCEKCGLVYAAADEIERLRNALKDERELRLNAETRAMARIADIDIRDAHIRYVKSAITNKEEKQ